MTKLKVGDQVEIINTRDEASRSGGFWHSFPVGSTATVMGSITEEGQATFKVDGISYTQTLQPANYRRKGEKAKSVKATTGKLIYAVVNKDGILELAEDREAARECKAWLGGKREGISIIAYGPLKEIR